MRGTLARILGISIVMASVLAGAAARANAVTEWNAFATDILAASVWQTGREPYGLAMVQAAVFDAVDAVHPRYLPFRSGVRAPAGTSDVAAIAEASYRVLRALAPDQAARIDAARHEAFAGIAQDALARGIAVGDAAAAAIIAERRQSGAYWAVADDSGSYVPSPTEPGDDASLPLLGIERGRPFVLTDVNQFLPAPPPPLDSAQFIRDLAETMRIGGAASVTRTPEQSRIAQFHVFVGVSPWSEIARQAATRHRLDLVDTARLLALVDLSIADCLSAGTEAKYTYKYVRPDKAAISIGVVGWSPAIAMPGTPEYPCQHCANSAAGEEAIESVLGYAPMVFAITSQFSRETRTFGSVREYAEEQSVSRIYGGVHYRWSNIVGSALGKQVARYVATTVMTPLAKGTR